MRGRSFSRKLSGPRSARAQQKVEAPMAQQNSKIKHVGGSEADEAGRLAVSLLLDTTCAVYFRPAVALLSGLLTAASGLRTWSNGLLPPLECSEKLFRKKKPALSDHCKKKLGVKFRNARTPWEVHIPGRIMHIDNQETRMY